MVIATRLLDLPRELFENIVARVVVEATDPVATLVDLKTVCLRMYREACRGKVVGMTLPLIRSLPRVADAVARENLIVGSAAVGSVGYLSCGGSGEPHPSLPVMRSHLSLRWLPLSALLAKGIPWLHSCLA